MPLYPFPQIYWYLITSIPLFVGIILITRILKYNPKEIGINIKGLFIQILIGTTGLIFGYIEYKILHPKPLIENINFSSFLIPSLILLFSTGFVEEIVFRGVMQKAFYDVMGKYGILAVCIVFASLHIGHLSFIDVIFVFGVSIFFSIVVLKTRSILGVTLSHGITNITLYLIYPFIF
jgi:membrane protease YdiL (CAAX protease family)